MTYGILYHDREQRVHVTMGDSVSPDTFMKHVHFASDRGASVIYARYNLTPDNATLFEQLAGRSGDIRESELASILAQLNKSEREKR